MCGERNTLYSVRRRAATARRALRTTMLYPYARVASSVQWESWGVRGGERRAYCRPPLPFCNAPRCGSRTQVEPIRPPRRLPGRGTLYCRLKAVSRHHLRRRWCHCRPVPLLPLPAFVGVSVSRLIACECVFQMEEEIERCTC